MKGLGFNPGAAWYLPSILFGSIGGVIGYFALKVAIPSEKLLDAHAILHPFCFMRGSLHYPSA